ncbi:SPARC-like isoform X2 [Limulus polyphemus]|uniref:SPARC-like isoform X2 n=1 Tax=Limulus polyphemus TaxID=6850 RepID=A0ABM1B377_LIMPO|nr:SPARC-like isoform X2 [Limulus polyphemus]
MKLTFCLLLSIILCTGILAKKHHESVEKKTLEEEVVNSDEKDELDLIAEDEAEEDDQEENSVKDYEELDREGGGYREDPCAKHHCGAGRVCVLDDKGKPACECITECSAEIDERRKVCSNHNETWNSYCELYRMRCWCDDGLDECAKDKYKHVHVDYYGSCREITKCAEDEMADFPRRMREWLFTVMQELAQRDELSKYYMKLEKEAEEDVTHKWANAIIWKFCDLDVHPEDRAISRHELFPIRAPLLAMEHCIAPFLDSCDVDDDHIITLAEWGKCLGLKENEIEDKCIAVHEKRPKE